MGVTRRRRRYVSITTIYCYLKSALATLERKAASRFDALLNGETRTIAKCGTSCYRKKLLDLFSDLFAQTGGTKQIDASVFSRDAEDELFLLWRESHQRHSPAAIVCEQ